MRACRAARASGASGRLAAGRPSRVAPRWFARSCRKAAFKTFRVVAGEPVRHEVRFYGDMSVREALACALIVGLGVCEPHPSAATKRPASTCQGRETLFLLRERDIARKDDRRIDLTLSTSQC